MDEDTEFFRGSGNAFTDLGFVDADNLQMKAHIAATIIMRQDELKITTRAAAKLADCDPADIQRIRNVDVAKFTIDRLLKYAKRMGCIVELNVTLPKAA